jgi:hypothetical protein
MEPKPARVLLSEEYPKDGRHDGAEYHAKTKAIHGALFYAYASRHGPQSKKPAPCTMTRKRRHNTRSRLVLYLIL